MKKLNAQETMNLNGGCFSYYDTATGNVRPIHTGCDGLTYNIKNRPELYAVKCYDCHKYAVYNRYTGAYCGYIKF